MPKKHKKVNRLQAKGIRKTQRSTPTKKDRQNKQTDFCISAKKWVRYAGAVLGALLGFFGLGLMIELYRVAPNVHIDRFDFLDPFRYPFIVDNKTDFPFYNVQPDLTFCVSDSVVIRDSKTGAVSEYGATKGEDIFTPTYTPKIVPNGSQDFYALRMTTPPISTEAPHQPYYTHLEVSVLITYSVLPINWARERVEYGFKMVIGSDGTRSWEPDDRVLQDIPGKNELYGPHGERPWPPKAN